MTSTVDDVLAAVEALPAGAVVSLVTVSVAAPPAFPPASVRVADRVSVPSGRPDTSILPIRSVAVAIVPEPVTDPPPPEEVIV